MTEHCPNLSCGSPIPPDQALPWCLTCGVRLPESLQLRLPRLQEPMAEAEARMSGRGLWVEETCVRCGTRFRTSQLRSFLGFRERECPNCHQHTVSPLPWGYRITYWLVFGFFAVFFTRELREEPNLLHEGAFYGFLLMVALMWAISRDLKIVYRQWASGRGSDNRKPGVALGRGEGQPVWSEEEAPSLVSRWWGGFVTLLASWFIVWWTFDTLEDLIDVILRGEAVSPNLLLVLKWGAYVILGPLIISLISGAGLKSVGLWTFWLRGLKTLLIGCLVVLPCILLYLASQATKPVVVVERGSQGESGLILLVLSMSLVLVPLWVAPLFRWLSRSRLADQASWFTERMSDVIGHGR